MDSELGDPDFPPSNVEAETSGGTEEDVFVGASESIATPVSVEDGMCASLPESEAGPSTKGNVSAVTPGVKDSDGFLTPPPASTLLIRRTRTNSTGNSTYVIASTPTQPIVPPDPAALPMAFQSEEDMRRSFSVPYRRLHKKSSRDRRSEPPYKRINFDNKKVNVLLTPQGNSPRVQINLPSGNGLHHRSPFPPISPLAIDPSHALSVTLSSDRSISTVVPIDSLAMPSTSASCQFSFPSLPSPSSSTSPSTSSLGELDVPPNGAEDKPKTRGKPAAFLSNEAQEQASFTGKGMTVGKKGGGKGKAAAAAKRRRGDRGPDRFPNIDPTTGRRKYIRKKRFSFDKRQSSRARLQSRSLLCDNFMVYDHELAGKWRPTDDLRLIVNVLQTNDLETVHRGVRFSCKFSLENIERRWTGLLYDKAVAKVSQNSIRSLHPRVIAEIHEKALFSPEEDRILKTVRSTHDPKMVKPVMEKLLKDNSLVFIKWRTAKSLVEHWLHLREYHLLCDQNVKDYFELESFSEFEDDLTEQEIRENYELDPNVRREMLIENRHTKKMIRLLEEEVSRWQVLADMVTEIDQTPFEEGSFAMLRGKQVRYLMRSREITLGRRTPESMNVDADLSLEGSTYKVSRRQATIQLRPLGDFAIFNQGKHAIYVDGNVIMPGKLGVILDQSVVEISQLRFVFLINHKLVTEQRKKLIRLEVKKEMLRLSKIARFIKAHPAYPIVHPSHPFMNPSFPSPRCATSISFTNQNNASATIDSVASNAGFGGSFPSTSRYTGSLTRPPQPRVGNTTFIRPYIPPPAYAARIHNKASVFRKPAPPAPISSTTLGTSSSSFQETVSASDALSLKSSTSVISALGPPSYSQPGCSNSIASMPSAISIRAPPSVQITKSVAPNQNHVAIHSVRPGPSSAAISVITPTSSNTVSVLMPPSSSVGSHLKDLTIRPGLPP